ncbi:MAG TPA: ferredoxin [Planctomycetota bacterium]|jgi:ferredoxin|nr:ferredoxin [Planctomycetota bacterium]
MPYDEQRYPDNADGAYYTTRDCVLCHTCHESAPGHFAMSADGDHMVVILQPTTQEERDLCAAAMEGCPMVAIRDDG